MSGCVMCRASAAVMWIIEIRVTGKRTEERTVCNRCELEHRRARQSTRPQPPETLTP